MFEKFKIKQVKQQDITAYFEYFSEIKTPLEVKEKDISLVQAVSGISEGL